jgi:signal transduction histidine kinase
MPGTHVPTPATPSPVVSQRVLLPDYADRILGAFPDAAMFVSASGCVTRANAAAREILNLDPAREASWALSSAVSDAPERLAATLHTWASATEPALGSFTVTLGSDSADFSAEGCCIVPDCILVRFWRGRESSPFLLLEQKIVELNAEVARRIKVEDELLRSQIALRERADEAEALNRIRDDFLATVSHELRTPLNAILGWATLLGTGAAEPQNPRAIEIIRRNAVAQAKLIDDVLDVSKLITGKLVLEKKNTDLLTLLGDAVEAIQPAAEKKQLDVLVESSPADYSLFGDPERIRQAFGNVLSNAVKFTPRGGRVRIAATKGEAGVSVAITDTGIGMSQSFVPLAFERFKQADSSITRTSGGLGLGLALVRHIVDLHGGSVSAESPGPDQGSTFTILLPPGDVAAMRRTSARAVVAEPERATPNSTPLMGLRVLVVDDEADARGVLEVAARGAGAEVATAASVAEAFVTLAQFRPHVVVSDIGMPVEDGYTLIRKLRQLSPEAGGTIPAIALTAFTRSEDRAKALAFGFDAHIGKPVNPLSVVSTIAGLARP